MINIAALLAFVLMLGMGQFFFKSVGLSIAGQPLLSALPSMAQQPLLYAALALYGAATLLWIWILSRIPLSQAYPWVALSIAVVPLAGALLFGERITIYFWLGLGLVVVGVLFIQYGAKT